LITVPVAGAFIYKEAKQRALHAALKTAIDNVRGDRLQAWTDSRARACEVATKHKRSAAAQVTCALLTAHLVARFSRENLAAALQEHLGLARKLAPKHPWTAVAELLRSASLPTPRPVLRLGGLPSAAKDWHVIYARTRVHLARGDVLQALKELLALDDTTISAALLKTGVRIARLQGDMPLRDKLLTRGLRLFPRHPGLRLEKAFVTFTSKRLGPSAELRKEAETIPSLRADLDLLLAHGAAQKGEFGTAADLAARATKTAPLSRPEAHWQGIIWRLNGGAMHASAAVKETTLLFPETKKLLPSAALDQARVLLLVARSDEARAALHTLPADHLSPLQKADRDALLSRAATGLGDLAALKRFCPTKDISREMLTVCAENYFELRRYTPLRRWAKKRTLNAEQRRYLKVLLALVAGDAERASSLLSKLPAKAIDTSSHMLLTARAAIGRYHLDQAISTLRKLVTHEHFSVRAQLALAKALVLRGNDTEARELLGEIEKAGPSAPITLAAIGDTWIALGNADRAALIAKKGTASHRKNHSLQLLAAHVALANRRYTMARRLLLHLLKRSRKDPEVHLDLGQIALHRGRERRASRYFARALRTRPKDPALRLSLAIAYARAGKARKALPHADYAIGFFERANQHGRAVDALISVGKLLVRGRPAARKVAEELLFRASTKSNAPPEAFYHLGLVHKAKGDAPRAIWCFKQVVRRAPDMALAHLQLGLVQIQKRKWKRKGLRALKRYLELDPKGPKARKVRAIIARHR
ncbi:MAG: tetratricopeptide repeat protein, partial [Deltaproteobacteria bacterium]|nr:tetratricopeptide repeat protein [Deltaproteobacteria bacterium]